MTRQETDAAVDGVIRYLYDSNDRLLGEELDLGADASVDKTTRYEYGPNADLVNDFGGDWTVQTRKTVANASGTPLSATGMAYDLQGRLETSTSESFQADGQTVARRDVTSYDYDHTGIRVSAHNTVEMPDESGQLVQVRDHATQYLVDHESFTGHEQVLVEKTKDLQTGGDLRTVIYTVGHDVIGQWSQGAIPEPGQMSGGSMDEDSQGSRLFLYDGHGSTRILAHADAWGESERPYIQRYAAAQDWRIPGGTCFTPLPPGRFRLRMRREKGSLASHESARNCKTSRCTGRRSTSLPPSYQATRDSSTRVSGTRRIAP